MREISRLRAESMTLDQLTTVIDNVLEAASAVAGREQERLLSIGSLCEDVLAERRASKAASSQDRSFLGRIAMNENELDLAEMLKGQVRDLMKSVIEGAISGFVFDRDGGWEGGKLPSGPRFGRTVNQFGIMVCYKAEQGASGIYVNPLDTEDTQRRMAEIICGDLDRQIDNALRSRHHFGRNTGNIGPRFVSAEEIRLSENVLPVKGMMA